MQSLLTSLSLLCSIKNKQTNNLFMSNAKQASWHLCRPFNYVCTHIERERGNYLKQTKKCFSSHFHLVEQSLNTYVHNSWILPEASCDQSPSFTVHCKVHCGDRFMKKGGLEITVSAWAGLMFQSIPKPSLPSLMASFSSLWSSS